MKVLCADHADVDVPVAQVYEFVTDVTRWPVWMSSIVNAQHPESLPLAVDEELLVCLHAGKRRWQETFEVKRLVRNAFLSLEGLYSAARRIDFRFEQRGRQTRVACAIGYPLFGGMLARWVDAISRRRRVRRDLRDSLVRLKGLLEEQVENTSVGESLFDPEEGALRATIRPKAEPATAH
jgi:uncharacterized membrane protein